MNSVARIPNPIGITIIAGHGKTIILDFSLVLLNSLLNKKTFTTNSSAIKVSLVR